MPLSFRRSLPITGVAVVMTGALALAQTHATPAPRVRPETRQAADLLNDLIAQSRTGRELVDMLNDSDILAYIRHRRFTTTTLDGRIGFVQSDAPTRTVIIEIGCERSWLDQLVTLGHELQHAAEIAASPAVVDPRSMATYFNRIGVRTSGPLDAAMFETDRAQRTAARIRHELLGSQRSPGGTRTSALERRSHERH